MKSFRGKRMVSFVTMAVILLLMTGCNVVKTGPGAEKGIMDLTRWSFAEDGVIKLDGEWDFYWNKLLDYNSLKMKKADLMANVADVWNHYKIGDKNLSGEGTATYRLTVNTSLPENTLLGLRLYTISSAYKLFINDQLVAQAGKVGENAGEEKGEYRPQMDFFKIPGKQFDIIIHVSNFHYARGGLWDSIYLGSVNDIQKLDNLIIGKEIFIIGILLIIALFYSAIFFMLRERKYTLYFALFCLFAVISVDVVDQFILINSSFPFDVVICIWYSATSWLVFFLILYMQELYPSRFSRSVSKVYLALTIIFQFAFLFTPPSFYTRFANVNNLSEIIAVVCALVIIIIGARQGEKGWLFDVLSIITLLASYIHDILYWTHNITGKYGPIFFIGAFFSIFLQMVSQAERIKQYFDQKVSAELLLLQAQIKPHFLYNTINTVISISRYDMDKARMLLTEFSQYLRRSFDFKGLSQLVPLKNEIELAKAYIAIEKARFVNKLEVNFDVQEDLEAKVPVLVLQPIIENAVKHGILPKPEGGRIDVIIKKEGRLLSFLVKDDGVGINMGDIESGTVGDRNSIGLENIDSRIRKLYRKGLIIKSEAGQGTEVKWCIHA